MGIVIIILSVKIKDADIYESAEDEVKKFGRAAFFLMIVMGCLALGTAIIGGLTAKWDRWPCIACVSNI